MAMRRFASQAASVLGVRAAPAAPFAAGEFGLRAAALRAYATVAEGLKYAKSHEWTKVDGETATVGISDFAQSELGDVVYVELPEVGSEVKKGETFGVVESVKAASDVYAPVSGEVVEVNNVLSDDPAKVNSEPFEGGWIMKVKVSAPGELDELLDAAAYTAHCEDGGH